jgi:hypothetical protein
MNWPQLQIDKAATGWTLIGAAEKSDINNAASIITTLTGILDFITFSFVRQKTTMSAMKTSNPEPYSRLPVRYLINLVERSSPGTEPLKLWVNALLIWQMFFLSRTWLLTT